MSVPRKLRDALAASRREGVPFEAAWPAALEAALDVASNREERRQWSVRLAADMPIWAAAYARVDTGTPDLTALVEDRRVPIAKGVCERCDEPIPHSRRGLARYCGEPCKRAAARERDRFPAAARALNSRRAARDATRAAA